MSYPLTKSSALDQGIQVDGRLDEADWQRTPHPSPL